MIKKICDCCGKDIKHYGSSVHFEGSTRIFREEDKGIRLGGNEFERDMLWCQDCTQVFYRILVEGKEK